MESRSRGVLDTPLSRSMTVVAQVPADANPHPFVLYSRSSQPKLRAEATSR
jgi:hypothetical protein